MTNSNADDEQNQNDERHEIEITRDPTRGTATTLIEIVDETVGRWMPSRSRPARRERST